ncbi:MAG: Dehydrogenases (flavoprotein) [halophilic archaeon J07HB67]|jgi:Dehydrogenases (flavoproteins)|nr:MAG: Dehydrogenases (flavoprotein) [halophilic archaeon J07HB67]
MERVDVAIVGGGPAGSSAAHAAASRGADTLVLEKGVPRADREELGPDSTDAAGILDYWVDIMGIHPDEFPDDVVETTLDRAEFVGPSESVTMHGTGVESSYDEFGYTMHRARFDDFLRDRAEAAGAAYRTGVSVRSVDTDTTPDADPRHVLHVAGDEQVAADHLILADGPQRTVTNGVLDGFLPDGETASDRLAAPDANHIAYQEYRRFPEAVYEEVAGAIRFWWGVMPGHTAYPWVFPNANRVCRVGLTMPIGLDLDTVENRDQYALLEPSDDRVPSGGEYVRRLLEREYGDEYDVEADFPVVETAGKADGTETYPISSTRPIESPARAGVAVVGGAMGATSAFHEGGDHTAVRTGAVAGRLAAQGRLTGYNDEWRAAIGGEMARNVTMAEMVRDYGPADWDEKFRTAQKMLTDGGSGGYDLFERKLTGGLDTAKLFLGYKLQKWQVRDGDYLQLTADEYVY